MLSAGTSLTVEDQENLLGDSRELLLNAVKRYVDWGKVPEAKQRGLIAVVEQVQRENIRRIAVITAGRSHKTIDVSVSGLKQDKDGNVESKIVAQGTEENVLGLFHAGRCVLVLVDRDVFMGERRSSEVLKDQPDLVEQADKTIEEQNVELLSEGIKPLDDSPAHDPETGEIVEGLAPIEERAPEIDQDTADGALEEPVAESEPKPKRTRRKAPAPELA